MQGGTLSRARFVSVILFAVAIGCGGTEMGEPGGSGGAAGGSGGSAGSAGASGAGGVGGAGGMAGVGGAGGASGMGGAGGTSNTIVTKAIGPEGGTIEADGIVVTVPPGAVGGEVTFSIEIVSEVPSEISSDDVLSRIYQLGPPGTLFDEAIRVEITANEAVANPDRTVLYWSRPGSGFDRLYPTIDGDVVTAENMHFSTVLVGESDRVDWDLPSEGSVSFAGATFTDAPGGYEEMNFGLASSEFVDGFVAGLSEGETLASEVYTFTDYANGAGDVTVSIDMTAEIEEGFKPVLWVLRTDDEWEGMTDFEIDDGVLTAQMNGMKGFVVTSAPDPTFGFPDWVDESDPAIYGPSCQVREFTNIVQVPGELKEVAPQGGVSNQPNHNFPDRDIGLVLPEPPMGSEIPALSTVYAAASADIISMSALYYDSDPMNRAVDAAITFRVCGGFAYFYGHVGELSAALSSALDGLVQSGVASCEPFSGIPEIGGGSATRCSFQAQGNQSGLPSVNAGDVVGTVGGTSIGGVYPSAPPGMEFSVQDYLAPPLDMVASQSSRHDFCPIDYFTDSMIRNAYEGIYLSEEGCGSVALGGAGMAGLWYQHLDALLGIAPSDGEEVVPFVRHTVNSAKQVIGTALVELHDNDGFAFVIDRVALADAPPMATRLNRDFREVTAGGKYCYGPLYEHEADLMPQADWGYFLVEQIDNETLMVERVTGAATCPATDALIDAMMFSANAVTLLRPAPGVEIP